MVALATVSGSYGVVRGCVTLYLRVVAVTFASITFIAIVKHALPGTLMAVGFIRCHVVRCS